MSPCAKSTRPCAQSRRASSLADEADEASVKPRVAPSSEAADGCVEALARSAIASLLKAGSFCAVGAGAGAVDATTVVLLAGVGEAGAAAAGAGAGAAAGDGTAEASLTGVALRTKTGFSTATLAPASDLSNCGQNAKPSARASAAALTPAPILIIWDISGLPIIAPPRSNASGFDTADPNRRRSDRHSLYWRLAPWLGKRRDRRWFRPCSDPARFAPGRNAAPGRCAPSD